MGCPSHKKIYDTLALAEDALIDARVRYDYADGQGPVTVYRCEDCAHYHLTSAGIMNNRLATMIKNGSIARMKEATRWTDKWK